MIPALHCVVVRRYPVALIEVCGVLRLDTAPVLRAAALKVLADRPTAVVLDLTDMDVLDPTAATVLAVIEQHAWLWADAAVLLAAPRPTARQALAALASDLALHETRAAALSAAAARPVPARMRMPFVAEPGAATAARELVVRACAAWHIAGITDRAAQVASELVTNVVEHAGTPGVLTVSRRTHLLHIAVRDGSRDPPVPRRPTEDGGYGLALVVALSAGWGIRKVPDGKVVWATLRLWPVRPGR